MEQYPYVGPDAIRARCRYQPGGHPISSIPDVERFAKEMHAGHRVIATYVINLNGVLLLADRHSEHVACASGAPVLSAGEIEIEKENGVWKAISISNQSTGYCPAAESWPQVESALDAIPLSHPGCFTLMLIFCHCHSCGQINVIKDSWYHCEVCGTALEQR